jgi:hypothetical protein
MRGRADRSGDLSSTVLAVGPKVASPASQSERVIGVREIGLRPDNLLFDLSVRQPDDMGATQQRP